MNVTKIMVTSVISITECFSPLRVTPSLSFPTTRPPKNPSAIDRSSRSAL